MIAFFIAILLLAVYIAIKSENDKVDVLGISALLCIVWGASRYAGATPKPLWDPN
jgi:hypothetical protein